MNYDTNDDPAEHDCAWFEEEVARLRAELASAKRVIEAAKPDCEGYRAFDDALARHEAEYPAQGAAGQGAGEEDGG